MIDSRPLTDVACHYVHHSLYYITTHCMQALCVCSPFHDTSAHNICYFGLVLSQFLWIMYRLTAGFTLCIGRYSPALKVFIRQASCSEYTQTGRRWAELRCHSQLNTPSSAGNNYSVIARHSCCSPLTSAVSGQQLHGSVSTGNALVSAHCAGL